MSPQSDISGAEYQLLAISLTAPAVGQSPCWLQLTGPVPSDVQVAAAAHTFISATPPPPGQFAARAPHRIEAWSKFLVPPGLGSGCNVSSMSVAPLESVAVASAKPNQNTSRSVPSVSSSIETYRLPSLPSRSRTRD